jgi:hypothetical protein
VSEILTNDFPNSEFHGVLLARLLVQMLGEDLKKNLEAKTLALRWKTHRMRLKIREGVYIEGPI